ncbi:EGF-like domain-containing protein [Tieghemostelium lacteum]|uniref:EGF-like domain-containing protein n=1 Tax=Tieghemostelium lacteum TaxID=361077 RepID=A0A152A7E4_TIELA|nr:EGF-like domain-containing protein [Tieghemostelium lacteum]|eukprot:KYR02149.1 EGF-like domain-containing protein [Tieghemostelium lacteum]
MNINKLHILIVLLLISVIHSQPANFDPTQLVAIQNLNFALTQDFDIANLCSIQPALVCDSTNSVIIEISLKQPPSRVTLNSPDLLALKNLTKIGIPFDIVLDSSFWDGLNALNQLNQLNILMMYHMPARFNNLPPSLENILFSEVYLLFPESIFTETPYLKELNIASQNGNSTEVLPTSISSPSNLTALRYTSYNQLIMGTNFDKLTSLYVFYRGSNPITFDSYDSFVSLSVLYIQVEDTRPPTPFPTSLNNLPKLISMTIGDQYIFTKGSNIIDMSVSIGLVSIQFNYIGFFRSLDYPGLKIGNPDFSVYIYYSDIDLNIMEIFNKSTFVLNSCNVYGSQPTGAYETISTLGYGGVIFHDDPNIPNDACRVKTSLALINTNLATIPPCFQCDWGSGVNPMSNNTNLPAYTQQCNGFQIISTTVSMNTRGSVIPISGIDMGWRVYTEEGAIISSAQVVIGNQLMKIQAPSGTGLNKQWALKFHYQANPSVAPTYININYLPPNISQVSGSMGILYIYGDNFGANTSVASLTIAGNLTAIGQIDHSNIVTLNPILPYDVDLVFSAKLVIDSQEVSWIQRPVGSVSSLTKPYPDLYSGGGIFELKGQYLSFDTTIMNLTIAGIPITRIVKQTPTSVIYSFDPIVAGNYSMEFNLDTLHISDYIQVTDTPPCKVVHGQCLGDKPICDPGYCGPDCSSIPANLTQPMPLLDTYPITTSNTSYTITFGGKSTLFRYTIKPLGIREVTSTDQTIHTYNISDYSLFMESPRYFTGTVVNASTAAAIIYWYQVATPDQSGLSVYLQSTVRYQVGVLNYVFASSDNHLEYDFQVVLQNDKPNDESSCSYYETGLDPTVNNYRYHKLKINNVDLFVRDIMFCYSGPDPSSPNCSTKTKISKSSNQIDMIFTKTIPYIAVGTSILDVDFNVYIDEKSAQQEINPVCFSPTQPPVTTEPPPLTQTPVVTKTPEQPKCPGDPVCNGHGTCNSHYKCDCTDGWSGTACDGIPSVIVPPETNPQKPETNVPQDEIAIHVIQSKNDQYQTLHYNTTLDGTNTNVDVEILYFYQDTSIEYAGSTSIKKQGTLKYSANITEYQYANNLNLLQVLFFSQAEATSDSTDSCTVKEVTVNDETSSVENIYIQVNDHTFMGTFSDLAVVDGRNRLVSNVIVPSNITDSNTKSNILIAITAPHHNNYIYIDPDFSLLISYGKPSDKEGSICSESKSKLSKAKIAGIVVGGVCFLGIAVAITIYAIKFNHDKKQLKLSLQKKLSSMDK